MKTALFRLVYDGVVSYLQTWSGSVKKPQYPDFAQNPRDIGSHVYLRLLAPKQDIQSFSMTGLPAVKVTLRYFNMYSPFVSLQFI